MLPLLNIDFTLPIENPVLKILIVLVIILMAPILLNKIKIPHLLGLIIAGAIIGPNGINLISRDSSIVVTGTTGLLYIMFLAGLEIDLGDFKRNRSKSLVFGMITFLFPIIFGYLGAKYLLNFSTITSVLVGSLIASHTLIAYPLISKAGVGKNQAVTISVGGTMITDTLALLVLAVIVGMTKGDVTTAFWIKLLSSVVIFGLIVLLIFPIIGRWFFKKVDDKILQYVFVLVMMFFGAVIAEIAGIEAIIGAFLAGLALNRLIPHTSPLMNRVEFVGNAYFIPFFLISTGMLINYKAFIKDIETLKVAAVITISVIAAKYLAAWLTRKIYKYNIDQQRLIFGLSVAQAAATLATVMVGYNIVVGETPEGEPIRLLSESVLNGSILTILITCTIASFSAQKGAKNIALAEMADKAEDNEANNEEKILIPINYPENTEDLIQLGLTIKSRSNKDGVYAMNVVETDTPSAEKHAEKLMKIAVDSAASADIELKTAVRFDKNVVNAITSVIKENDITTVVLGLTKDKGISNNFLGNLSTGILKEFDTTVLVYKPTQPLSTIKRHLVVVPNSAEKEIGFPFWLLKLWNIARNTGASLVFYADAETNAYIQNVSKVHPVACEFRNFISWDDFLIISRDVKDDDNLVVVLGRDESRSFSSQMRKIPAYLNNYFSGTSFILIYPLLMQDDYMVDEYDYRNPSMMQSIEKFDEIANSISTLFKKK